MVDKGDIGGIVGGAAAGGLAAKLITDGILTTTLGPVYLIASTIFGYYVGHEIAHGMSAKHT